MYAGHIGTRLVEAHHQPTFDGIGTSDEHDRDRRGGSLGSERGWRSERGDYCRIPTNQVGSHRRKPLELTLGPAIFDRDIAPLGITVFVQSSPEHIHPRRECVLPTSIEEPNQRHIHPLTAGDNWPRRRCAPK